MTIIMTILSFAT